MNLLTAEQKALKKKLEDELGIVVPSAHAAYLDPTKSVVLDYLPADLKGKAAAGDPAKQETKAAAAHVLSMVMKVAPNSPFLQATVDYAIAQKKATPSLVKPPQQAPKAGGSTTTTSQAPKVQLTPEAKAHQQKLAGFGLFIPDDIMQMVDPRGSTPDMYMSPAELASMLDPSDPFYEDTIKAAAQTVMMKSGMYLPYAQVQTVAKHTKAMGPPVQKTVTSGNKKEAFAEAAKKKYGIVIPQNVVDGLEESILSDDGMASLGMWEKSFPHIADKLKKHSGNMSSFEYDLAFTDFLDTIPSNVMLSAPEQHEALKKTQAHVKVVKPTILGGPGTGAPGGGATAQQKAFADELAAKHGIVLPQKVIDDLDLMPGATLDDFEQGLSMHFLNLATLDPNSTDFMDSLHEIVESLPTHSALGSGTVVDLMKQGKAHITGKSGQAAGQTAQKTTKMAQQLAKHGVDIPDSLAAKSFFFDLDDLEANDPDLMQKLKDLSKLDKSSQAYADQLDDFLWNWGNVTHGDVAQVASASKKLPQPAGAGGGQKPPPPPNPPPTTTPNPPPQGKHTPDQKVVAKKKLFAKDLEKTLGIAIPPEHVQDADELSIGAFKKNLGKTFLDDLQAASMGKPTSSGLTYEQLVSQALSEAGLGTDAISKGTALTLSKGGIPPSTGGSGTPVPPKRSLAEEAALAAATKAELDALVDKYTAELELRLSDAKAKIVKAGATFQNPPELINYGEKIAGEVTWQQALTRVLAGSADLGAKYGIGLLEGAGFAFDWTLSHKEAAEWARSYSFDLVRRLDDTTRALLRDAVSGWIESGEPLPGLSRRLESAFGKKRAELIASTEATRAYAKGSHIIYKNSGVVSHMQWLTANDELVCPICGPLGGLQFASKQSKPASLSDQWKDGTAAEIDGDFTHPGGEGEAASFAGKSFGLPPAHPRCRCRIAPVLSRLAFAQGVVIPPPADGGPGSTSLEYRGPLVEFGKGPHRGQINGVSLESQPPPDWKAIPGVPGEPPPLKLKPGVRQSAGVVVVEPDGRMWVVEPTNHYGGYEHTFAKGGLEDGYTLQQTALKEAYEEMGLNVAIDGYLTDAEGSTSNTRYYLARRIGGDPGDAHWETDKVKLATPEQLRKMLNTSRDKATLEKALAALEEKSRPKPKTVDENNFPLDPEHLDRLEVVRKLGGSTGAELVRDPVTGKQFVRKRGASEKHLREEVYADQAYQGLGVAVPRMRLYETKGRPTKLSEFIDGTETLGSLKTSDPRRYQRALAELKKDMAADALLANWDVMGASYDNILVDAENKVWRIDNGGGLRYRAQGSAKPGWNEYPTELWTMRDPRKSSEAGPVYKDLGIDDVVSQLKRYNSRLPQMRDVVSGFPQELQTTLMARLKVARGLAEDHELLRADQWSDRYTDAFLKHSVGLRDVGIVGRLPKELTKKPGLSLSFVDENGEKWDKLRGGKAGYISQDFWNYVDQNGGSHKIPANMMMSQRGDSWNSEAQAVKAMIAQERNNVGAYWYKGGVAQTEKYYAEAKKKYSVDDLAYLDSMAALHAMNYEIMRNVDFIHNDRANGTVTLMRTEQKNVMSLNNLATKGKKGVIKRGPSESTSIWKQVIVYGTENTVMEVPHIRVLGTYFLSEPGDSDTIMLGDGENEFIAMLDGLESHYVSNEDLKKLYGFELKY